MLLQVHSILTVVGAQPLFVVDEGKLVGLITWPEVMTDGFNINYLVTDSFAVNSVKLTFLLKKTQHFTDRTSSLYKKNPKPAGRRLILNMNLTRVIVFNNGWGYSKQSCLWFNFLLSAFFFCFLLQMKRIVEELAKEV